jgi:hypothetical protein
MIVSLFLSSSPEVFIPDQFTDWLLVIIIMREMFQNESNVYQMFEGRHAMFHDTEDSRTRH